ncbi:neutral zinc metallopeptidase [Streptosporangium sp. NPDC050855]|uniref:neutral zinc metallopeptidase n=1 Tax=Streptosporangium sp. NPDC050855 TaxID=3366194 RepID=UPI0037B8D603
MCVALVVSLLVAVPAEVTAAEGSEKAPASVSAATRLDDMYEDIGSARYVIDRFWETHWSEFFPGRYSSPRVLGTYDGARGNGAYGDGAYGDEGYGDEGYEEGYGDGGYGEGYDGMYGDGVHGGGGYDTGRGRTPTCHGYPLPDDNALYCWPPYDFVAWDVDLMSMGYRQGDAWIYLIVAHEWSHAVQARIPQRLVSRQIELQADCLAGATLWGAGEDGTLHFEEGDTREIAAALRQHADDTPWTDVNDHGTAAQRLSAFNRGALQGVGGCLT